MTDLKRIANALEHLALPTIGHPTKTCAICSAKKKPVKRMPASVILSSSLLARREAEIRQQKILHGPEEPVADMFRYRELNRPPNNS